MPSTTYFDPTFGARAIGNRTDDTGTAATDLTAEEDRFESADVTAGYVTPADSFVVAADATWDVSVGSGTTKADIYAVKGTATGQGTYIVRLDQAGDTVTISAADGSNPRIDEVYLVVVDNDYDAGGLSLPRLAYREGTAAGSPSAPGPDPAWDAYVLLATIDVPAAAANIGACTITDERSASQLVVDAPTLQGYSSEDFSEDVHVHGYTPISHVNSTDGHPVATPSTSGFMSAADKSKLDGIEAGAEVNDGDSEVLTLLKTVDGSGSVLDADTIDGTHLSGFATSGHTHDSRYYTESEVDSKMAAKADPSEIVHVTGTGGSIPTGTATILDYTAQVTDDWGGWSSGGSSTYVYDDGAGYYLIVAEVVFASSTAGGVRQAAIRVSGSDIALGRHRPTSGDTTVVQVSAIAYLDGSDNVQTRVYHNAGSALNVTSNSLKVLKLG